MNLPLAIFSAVAALVVVSCGTPRPAEVVPYGTVMGRGEKLDDGRVKMRAVGVASAESEARFFAREAAALTTIAPEKVGLPVAKLRERLDEWRAIVQATVTGDEWELADDPPATSGGVKVTGTVVVDTQTLMRRVAAMAQTQPQSRPRAE